MNEVNAEYLRWLEGRWDTHRFDLPGGAEREERRTEELSKMFGDLGELAKRRVNLPDPPSRWGADY